MSMMYNYNRFLTLELNQQCNSTSNQTLKSVVKQLIATHLSKFEFFKEDVIYQYPNLASSYLRVIDFPVSLDYINERLSSSQLLYYFLGDVLRDLLLIPGNCRQFNGESVQQICSEFEVALFQFTNALIKQYIDFKPPLFTSFQFLNEVVLKNFVPGLIPKCLATSNRTANNRNKARAPWREEVDDILFFYNKLGEIDQSNILAALMRELEHLHFNSQGNLTDDEAVIDFGKMKPQIFWFFYEAVLERFPPEQIIQLRQQVLKLKGDSIEQCKYFNINKEISDQAINQIYGENVPPPPVEKPIVNQTVENQKEELTIRELMLARRKLKELEEKNGNLTKPEKVKKEKKTASVQSSTTNVKQETVQNKIVQNNQIIENEVKQEKEEKQEVKEEPKMFNCFEDSD
ncbi:Bromodomain_containing protein [Hexamita inflata]|uniref:Bromodomain containing protein n=1 Tax=Hexamita inflata TaxID=28002 RepID=A0AA86QUY8_9EUKA|nr:Bromodomain containing protein [Hexamita inflata]